MLSRTTSHNDDSLQNWHELQTGMNTTGFVPVPVHTAPYQLRPDIALLRHSIRRERKEKQPINIVAILS